MRVFRLLVAVMLLGFIVGAPLTSAAEPRPGARQAQGIAWSTPNPLDSLRNLLVSFWSTMGLGSNNKEGCAIDPAGRCITGPQKTGCEIDPWGRCITTPESSDKTSPTAIPLEEEGCAIDPWGVS